MGQINRSSSTFIKMNKLCLVLLGVLAIAAIASAFEVEENSGLSEELASSRLVRSPDADAKRRKGKKSRGKGRRKGMGKRKGKGKKKGRKNRRNNKKARKGRKSRKNRKSNKGRKGRKNEAGKRMSGRTVSDACFEQSMTIMRMWKDIISNFEKQKKRMEKQNGTGANKLAKKGEFLSINQKLISAGGGDKSNMSCGGATGNAGANQLKNLTATLGVCETSVKDACNHTKWPKPNMTKIEACDKLATSFKTAAQSCLDKTIGVNATDTTTACTCWTNSSLAATVTAAKDCKFSTEAKAVATALKNCTKAFGKCRKYEDDAAVSIATCATNKTALHKKVATLTKNKNSLTLAQEKVKKLAANSTNSTTSSRSNKTCAQIIQDVTELTTLVFNFASHPSKIQSLANDILSIKNVSCTAAEKVSLQEHDEQFIAAIYHMLIVIATHQEQL